MARHHQATRSVNTADDEQQGRDLTSRGSLFTVDYKSPFLEIENPKRMKEERQWIKVASSKSYIPTMDNAGYILRLEYAIVDSSGSMLFPTRTIETNRVIIAPNSLSRRMIKCPVVPEGHSSNDLTFTVLSYNILADMCTLTGRHSYCQTWALVWEYRRKKLLEEIIGYDADIICLQEVIITVTCIRCGLLHIL